MSPELDKQLCEKYPLIFADRSKSMQESCMFWGLDVGNGWYNLLDQLCSFLQFHTDKNDYPQVIATQVKEKFGTLSFYNRMEKKEGSERSYEMLDGAISFAELISGSICENCGNPGKISGKGWLKTRCETCLAIEDSPVKTSKE